MNDFVRQLEARRVELGLNHREMSQYLGMNFATWVQTKNGKWPCGPAFIGRVIMARPEFARFLPIDKEVPAA